MNENTKFSTKKKFLIKNCNELIQIRQINNKKLWIKILFSRINFDLAAQTWPREMTLGSNRILQVPRVTLVSIKQKNFEKKIKK